MSVSRRRFLKSGAVVAAALVLKPGTLALGRHSLGTNNNFYLSPSSPYSREMFAPYVGELFRVTEGGEGVDLQLVALEKLPQPSRGLTTGKTIRTDCFSLRFQGATPLPADEGLYTFNHRMLGSFDLYINQSKVDGYFVQTAIINNI